MPEVLTWNDRERGLASWAAAIIHPGCREGILAGWRFNVGEWRPSRRRGGVCLCVLVVWTHVWRQRLSAL